MDGTVQWNDPVYWDIRTKVDDLASHAIDQNLSWERLEQFSDWLSNLVEERKARLTD